MIKNLTPAHMRCTTPIASCPSLHQLEDGRLLVVGGQVEPPVATLNDFANPEPFAEIAGKVGPGEAAIIIPPSLLDDYVAEKVREAVLAERERCAKIAYKAAEDADQGGKETPAGRDARKIGNAIRFDPPISGGGEKC